MLYFSWAATGEAEFGPSHYVEDEKVFYMKLAHAEGGFATMTISIINPSVGLLSEGRDQWMWMSYDDGDTVTPLFFGRLIAVPEDLDRQTLTLSFQARPADFDEQKIALAESLRVAPYWDPIWVDEDSRDDLDVVLEGYTSRYHIGRVDKVVTVSDILIGDATLAFGPDDILKDSLRVSYDAPPIQKMRVEATVSWDQYAQGTVDYSKAICAAAGDGPFKLRSFQGQGFEDDYPKFGDEIGAGWKAFDSRPGLYKTGDPDDVVFVTLNPRKATPDFEIQDWWTGSLQGYQYHYNQAYQRWLSKVMTAPIRKVPLFAWSFRPTFVAMYQGRRGRKEVLTFEVNADMQALLANPEESEITEDYKISSDSIVDPIDPDGSAPIGLLARNTYFGLDRGKQSIAALLTRVRAAILRSARAANITFAVPVQSILNISCRHDAVLTHAKLPGGTAAGKVIAYELTLDAGAFTGSVTVGCSIGKGNTLGAPSEGTPTYVEENYVEDYQFYAGSSIMPVAGEITYDHFVVTPNDDGLDFLNMTAENTILAVSASALLSFDGVGEGDDTITIGARVYTLVSALTAPNQVLLGGTFDITAAALAYAINRDETMEGFLFSTGTEAHADVTATVNDGIVRVTARTAGEAGNLIAVSSAAVDAVWGTATLVDGHAGLKVYYPADEMRAEIEGQEFGSWEEAKEALKLIPTEVDLALKPVTGGPFETPISITVSDLMVPKTIDLEAV